MTRRNPDRYTPQDWKRAGRTVDALIDNRWLVFTECDLWGRSTTCRRMGCPGRVTFWVCARTGRAGMWR